MGSVVDAFKSAFRDFVTDGVPASGPNEPNKAEVRAIGPVVESAIGAAAAGFLSYDTKPHLIADTTQDIGTLAYVYDDANPANNTFYQYESGGWVVATWFYEGFSGIVQPLVDEAEGFADAADSSADAAAASAATTAGAVSNVLPVLDNKLSLAKRDTFLTTNSASKAVLAADGYWHYTNGFAVTIDHVLTAAELAAGTVNLDLYDPSGGTWTVEQRSASTSIVAATAIPTVGSRRYGPVTFNPGTVTILRVAGTRTNGTTGMFGALTVRVGTPAEVPTDDDYWAVAGGLWTTNDGLNVAVRLDKAATPGGVQPVITGTLSFSLPTGTSGVHTMEYTLTKAAIALGGNVTMLINIASNSLAPKSFTVAPMNGKKASGTAVIPRRFGSNSVYVATVPLTAIGGLPVDRIALNIENRAGGVNGAPDEAMTGSALVFSGDKVPKLRASPAVVASDIATGDAATLAAALAKTPALAKTAAIDFAQTWGIAGMITQLIYQRDHALGYVDSVNGLDANSGLTVELPKKTREAADALTGLIGRGLAFKAGQIHPVIPAGTAPGGGAYFTGNYNWSSYGDANYPAFHDCRFDLSTATWVNVSGNLWKTAIAFKTGQRQAGLNNLTSTNFALWLVSDILNDPLGTRLIWKCTGADQATNQAAVAATPGSMTINVTGSTVPDPRTGPTGQYAHDIYVCMPDGSNPNGANLRMTYDSELALGAVFTATDFWGSGGGWKDAFGGGAVAQGGGNISCTHYRYRNEGFGGHGWVGLANFRGGARIIGRAIERAVNDSLGRSGGGGLTLFGGDDLHTDVLTLEGHFVIGCVGNGVYGHNSGVNYGGNSTLKYVEASKATFRMFNISICFGQDESPNSPTPWSSAKSTFGRADCGPWTDPSTGISYEGCDTFLTNSGGPPREFNGGSFTTGPTTSGGSGTFIQAFGGDISVSGTGPDDLFRINNRLNFGAPNFYGSGLVTNVSTTLADITTLRLKYFIDDTVIGPANPGKMKCGLSNSARAGSGNWSDVILYLNGYVTLGDIASSINGPLLKGLWSNGVNNTYGWGNRTGPEIDALFQAAGMVDGVNYHLDGQDTIVGRAGEILSMPGWK